MSLSSVFCVGLLLVFAAAGRAGETAAVEVHPAGQPRELSAVAQQELGEQAVRLVESSNFHSDPGDQYHIFNLPDVQRDYRREVAGRFLLVVFPIPRKIETVGGGITVSEIVVGLNRDDYASNLFTIDDSGRVVGHGKFSGERCILLLDAVKRFVALPPPTSN